MEIGSPFGTIIYPPARRIIKLFIATFHGKLKIQTERKCNTPSRKPNNVILMVNKVKKLLILILIDNVVH